MNDAGALNMRILRDMLDKAGIDYESHYGDMVEPYGITRNQVFIDLGDGRKLSAVSNIGSYGYKAGLIECWDFIEDDPQGWLDAQEAFDYLVEHGANRRRTFGFGDYVVYESDYKPPEIGRVVSETIDGDGYFVCYHSGCTAASTPKDMLRAATADEIASAPHGLGYHRFDDSCPEYDDRICYGICHDRFGG